MEARLIDDIHKINAEDWDALVCPNDPFMRYNFLSAMERTGCADAKSGWTPMHFLLYDNDVLLGAAPSYLKTHSYGEYIFDWSWANGAERAGIPYYPKLLCAVPFTPATGNRLLAVDASARMVMWSGMRQIASRFQASSSHVLFLKEEEYRTLSNQEDTITRLTYQFHWTNPGVSSFDEWLGLFRSKSRKNIKRERRKAMEGIDAVYYLRGEALEQRHIDAMWRFYLDTISRKWGRPYLTKAFFNELRTSLAPQTLVFFAEQKGRIIASSLCFQQGQHLYGRYWGCSVDSDYLHFELCYHRPIELCIQKGWTRFEAGAQGQHKLKRGLLASPTYSVHWIAHKGLHDAVEHAVSLENAHTEQEIKLQNEHTPFRRET